MGKIRVYELARMMNMKIKELLDKLDALNIPVSSHMSLIDKNLLKDVDFDSISICSFAEELQSKYNIMPGDVLREEQRHNFPTDLCGRQHVCGNQQEVISINSGMFQRNGLRMQLRQYAVSDVPWPAGSIPDLTFSRHKTKAHPSPKPGVLLKQEQYITFLSA